MPLKGFTAKALGLFAESIFLKLLILSMLVLNTPEYALREG